MKLISPAVVSLLILFSFLLSVDIDHKSQADGTPTADTTPAAVVTSTPIVTPTAVISSSVTWSPDFTPIEPHTSIGDLEIYKGNLYTSGWTYQSNGRIYKYDGLSWTDLNFDSSIGARVDLVQALLTYEDRLYIGTRVYFSETMFSNVYAYDGSTFTLEFSSPGEEGYSGIEDLVIYDGGLLALNGSRSAGQVYLKGPDGTWDALGGVIEEGSPVRAVASYDGWLYAGTGTHGNHAKVWRWNGTRWYLVKDLFVDFSVDQDGVCGLHSLGDQLIVTLCGPGSPAPVYRYDGLNWFLEMNIDGCHTSFLSFVDDFPWIGSCEGQVFRKVGLNYIPAGNTGEYATGKITRYGNELFAGTNGYNPGNGKIYKAPSVVSPSGVITSPTQNSKIGNESIQLSADAWTENPNGIQEVAFMVYYNSEWHAAGIDNSAPYTVTWQAPLELEPQLIQFAIHVTDNDNFTTQFAGGVRTVSYIDALNDPNILVNWLQDRAYLNQRPLAPSGDEMSGAASMAMVLAMNGMTDVGYEAMKAKAEELSPQILDENGNVTIQLMDEIFTSTQGLQAVAAQFSESEGWSKIKQEIDASRPVIVQTKEMTQDGHFIVAVGYQEKAGAHILIAYDPYGKWLGTQDDFDQNSSTDLRSRKGRWVSYNFETVFGDWLLTAQKFTLLAAVSGGAPIASHLTPPDLTSNEPGHTNYNHFIFIPIIYQR